MVSIRFQLVGILQRGVEVLLCGKSCSEAFTSLNSEIQRRVGILFLVICGHLSGERNLWAQFWFNRYLLLIQSDGSDASLNVVGIFLLAIGSLTTAFELWNYSEALFSKTGEHMVHEKDINFWN
jgi:hypothetical protein